MFVVVVVWQCTLLHDHSTNVLCRAPAVEYTIQATGLNLNMRNRPFSNCRWAKRVKNSNRQSIWHEVKVVVYTKKCKIMDNQGQHRSIALF